MENQKYISQFKAEAMDNNPALEKLGVKLSVIARGISVGDELEYADEVTLGRSIVNRTPFTGTV